MLWGQRSSALELADCDSTVLQYFQVVHQRCIAKVLAPLIDNAMDLKDEVADCRAPADA